MSRISVIRLLLFAGLVSVMVSCRSNKAVSMDDFYEKSEETSAVSEKSDIPDISEIIAGSPEWTDVIISGNMTVGMGSSLKSTPYGLAAAPVIKVCSRNDMKEQWPDLIDINAGPIATGDASIQDIGTLLFNEIIDVASGRKQSFAEKYKLYNDLCIFNPAPIT